MSQETPRVTWRGLHPGVRRCLHANQSPAQLDELPYRDPVRWVKVTAVDKARNESSASVPAAAPDYRYCYYDLTIQEAPSGTHPGPTLNGYTLVDGEENAHGYNGDLNAGALGPSLYLVCETRVDLWKVHHRNPRALQRTCPDPGWTYIDTDANKGALAPQIHLEYSTDPAVGRPVSTGRT